jgi:hypothetical protein
VDSKPITRTGIDVSRSMVISLKVAPGRFTARLFNRMKGL